VNTIEDRLRDAYRAAAQTIPPEAAADLGHRPVPPARRRAARFLVPAAAATAVLAVIALVTVVARGGQPGPSAGAPAVGLGPITPSASPARYFLAFQNQGQGSVADPLSVFSASSGRLIAAVSGPQSAVQPQAAAALGDGSTFIVANTTGPSSKAACAGTSRLYRLRLAADGQPASLVPLALPAIAGNVDILSATPDGGMIAYDSQVCDLPMAGMSVLGVMNTATGRVRQWTWPKPGVDVSWLSLSDNGRTLTYLWQRDKVITSYEGQTLPAWTVSQQPADATAGSAGTVAATLLAGSGKVPVAARYRARDGRTMGYGPAAVTADGTTIYYCQAVPDRATTASPAGYGLMAVREYDVAARKTTTLHTFSGQGFCYLSLSGGQLLVGVVNGANTPRSSLFRLEVKSRAVTPVPDPGNVNPLTW
jgi:hypothetical protein